MSDIKDRRFIGEKIKKRRKELAMSQEKLAEQIGITYQQLQRYENGSSQIGTDRLQAITGSLEVPIAYFFEEEKTTAVSEGATQYLSSEEELLLRYFRKIFMKEYKKALFVFLKLATEIGCKNHK